MKIFLKSHLKIIYHLLIVFLDSLTGSSIEATNVTQVHSLMRQYNDSFNKIVELDTQANKLLTDFNIMSDTIKQELSNFDSLSKKNTVF